MDTENIYTLYLLYSFIHPVLPEVENRCLHGQGLPTSCSAVLLLLTVCILAMMEPKVGSIPVLVVGKCNHLRRAEGESLNPLSYRQYVQPACSTLKGDWRLSTDEQNGLPQLSGFG